MNREMIPIVSYPKSGNTYLRFLLANIVKKSNKEITFDNINYFTSTTPFISDINYKRIEKNISDNSPILIKEHQFYGNHKDFKFNKVIYLYRDITNVIDSYYHFTNAQKPGLFKSPKDFVMNYWNYCGYWGAHVESWLGGDKISKDTTILAVSYENLVSNTKEEVLRIMNFLNLSVTEEKIEKAIYDSSKDKLRSMKSDTFMNSKTNNFHFVRHKNVFENIINDSLKKYILSEILTKKWLSELYNYNELNMHESISKKIKYYPSMFRKYKMNLRYRLYHLFNE